MEKRYGVFETWSKEVRFHDGERDALEDFEICVAEIQEKEEMGHEIILLEVVKIAKTKKGIEYV